VTTQYITLGRGLFTVRHFGKNNEELSAEGSAERSIICKTVLSSTHKRRKVTTVYHYFTLVVTQ